MKKKKSRIPEFKTITEEATFWDTHDFTEFEDELTDVDIVFDLHKPRTKSLVVRVQEDFKQKLEKIARSRGLNVSTLARMWLMEKLQSYWKATSSTRGNKQV